jgi:hypothetical protein
MHLPLARFRAKRGPASGANTHRAIHSDAGAAAVKAILAPSSPKGNVYTGAEWAKTKIPHAHVSGVRYATT